MPKSSLSLRERFEQKFTRDANGCWVWHAATCGKRTYGSFCVGKGKIKAAHRAAYEIYCAPISAGAHVLHRCDNPRCVNPEHLFLGTHAENMADMKEKGRRKGVTAGEQNGRSVLTRSLAAEVLAFDGSYNEAARRFGVHKSTIARIRTGRAWSGAA
jgi:hypothetical protein